MRRFLIAAAGALLLGAPPARAAETNAGAVAYPANPSGTPQAENNGAPVVTDKAACASGTKCPDRPPASTAADSGSVGHAPATSGGVKVPSTAYPDSPVPTPAAEPTGTAPK